jgi:hypothetical protein
VDGLVIQIPQGAYPEEKQYSISYRPITDSKSGGMGKPISPLIHIDNGGEYSKKPILVRIPVAIQPNQIATASFYDPDTGKMDAIPVLAQGSTAVVIATQHFSDVLVEGVPQGRIPKNSPNQFTLGVDNWQFSNLRTYAEPGGNCDGMSLSSLYYFLEKKEKLGMPSLYGQYDNYNNPYHTTPKIEVDDTLAIKLISMAQKVGQTIKLGTEYVSQEEIEAILNEPVELSGEDPISVFHQISQALAETGMPQQVSLRTADDKTGHSLIAYKQSGWDLYLIDPNFPSVEKGSDRKITFDPKTNSFTPYQYWEGAANLATPMTRIEFYGNSALFDWSQLDPLWEQFENGTIGAGEFPAYEITILEKDYAGSVQETKLTNNYQTDDEEIELKLTSFGVPLDLTLYRSTTGGEEKVTKIRDSQSVVIPLEIGVNSLGFHVQSVTSNPEADGQLTWAGFEWMNVIRNEVQGTVESHYTEPLPITTPEPNLSIEECNALKDLKFEYQDLYLSETESYYACALDGKAINQGSQQIIYFYYQDTDMGNYKNQGWIKLSLTPESQNPEGVVMAPRILHYFPVGNAVGVEQWDTPSHIGAIYDYKGCWWITDDPENSGFPFMEPENPCR